MDNEFLKYVKPKDEKPKPPKPPEPPAPVNAAQNLAPAYDASGNYLGMEVVEPPAANNAYGEDVIKAVKSFGRGADAVVRGAADTLTLGSIDRLSAGLGAATGIGGEFGEYSKNLEAQRAASRADQEERAPLRLMGQIAGGVVGPSKGLKVLQNATTLPGRAIGGAVAGASAGVPYGYFSSDADLNSMAAAGDALKGGAAGGIIGGAAPVVGNAIGRAVDFVRNRVSPDQFSTLPRVTQRNLESLSRDMDLQRVQAEANRLGPNAMLADVSPDMRLVAQNAATRPGVAPVVSDPLMARDAARNDRLTSALNQSFGPNVDRTVVNDRLSALRKQAGSEFERLSNTAQNDMPAFGTLTTIDAIKASPVGRNPGVAEALSQIERVLTNQNTNAVGRSAAEFHAARRLADDILQSPSTSGSVKSAVQSIRNELDDALKSGVSGWKGADARFADIAKRQEAFDAGQTVFNSGREALRPDEYARYLSGLNKKQTSTERLGARAELDRIVGQSNNDLRSLQNTLKLPGDDPARKMEMLFGADRTRKFYDAKDAERIFADTNNRVNNGSQTAQRQGANQLLSAGSETAGAGAPTSIPEMVMAARKRFSDAVRDAAYGKVNEDSARQLARMTVAQGPERDAFIRALQGRANRTDPELDIERTLKALRPGAVAGLLSDGQARKRQ
jgi:hypothetical protein